VKGCGGGAGGVSERGVVPQQPAHPLSDPEVAAASHRFGCLPQRGGIGADPGEQVDHLDAAVAPAAREADQAPQRGVVTAVIGAPVFVVLLRRTRAAQGGWA